MADLSPYQAASAGTALRVHLQPGAGCDAVAGRYGDALKIALKAPPVDGKANAALRRFLADALGVTLAAVVINHGSASRNKTVTVNGITPEEAYRLLEVASAAKKR